MSVRRMRPTFGYVIAATRGLQMAVVAYVIVANPANAGQVVEAFAALGTIWTVGLSVLGVYVYKRSEEKRPNSGMPPGGAATMIARILNHNAKQ